MSEQLAPPDTAPLFRSVRAARGFAQNGIAALEGSPVRGCVTLKPGKAEPPVFMLPGAAGSILQIAPLAGSLTVPMPIYAVRPRGMEPGEAPCAELGEMAEHAIGVIRGIRPHGPYLLVGYSAGGLVALEAARRLTDAGEPVPLVVLLDTYPSREIWPLSCHLDILVRQSLRALWMLKGLALRQAAADIARRARSLLRYLAASGLRLVPPPPVVAEGSDAVSRRVHLATYNAGKAYRPTRYNGRVVFIQPEFIPNLEPRAPRRVWGRYLPDLAIRRVPGSHLRMLDDDAAAAAAAISRCLDEARA